MPVATEIPVGIVLRRLHTCVLSVQDRIVRVSKRVDRSRSSSTPLITSFERVTFRSEADITGSRLQRIFSHPFASVSFRGSLDSSGFTGSLSSVLETIVRDRSIDRTGGRLLECGKDRKKKFFPSTCLYVSSWNAIVDKLYIEWAKSFFTPILIKYKILVKHWNIRKKLILLIIYSGGFINYLFRGCFLYTWICKKNLL